MCKRTYRHEQIAPVAAGAYQGQTIRMSGSDGPGSERRHNWARGFPWWALWLIWPLIGVLKWAAPMSASALAALRDNVGAFERPATALVALAMIIIGLALIRRR